MTLGSTMIGSVGYAALGGNLTGSGPTNRKLNKTLQETGWQPYSLVFTKDQLSTEDLKFLQTELLCLLVKINTIFHIKDYNLYQHL